MEKMSGAGLAAMINMHTSILENMEMSDNKESVISPEDENMDAELARGLTKLNFEKSCADIYSQIVAEITHNAKLGFSVCVVSISADDNIMAWVAEKLRGKGFEVEWEHEEDFSVGMKCMVQWDEEGHE